MTNDAYKSLRLSPLQHYFGRGIIGSVWREENSKNYFAKIENFALFNEAVPFKDEEGYLERRANEVSYNYFRGNAVRVLSESEFNHIASKGKVSEKAPDLDAEVNPDSLTSLIPEGRKTEYYVTKYERVKRYRDLAIKIHGYSCKVCEINFKETYGDIGEGFIHVHHVKPLHSLDEQIVPDPKTDLVPVCPNCHAMLHRKKGEIITVEDLRKLLFRKK
jgi:putative restriction endonuclease